MQLQNNNKQKIVLIVSIVVVIALFAIAIFSILNKRSQLGESVDKPSGETISDPKNREAENFNSDDNEIVFYGMSELSRAGLSSFMVESIRAEFYIYSEKKNFYIESVSIYKDSIDHKISTDDSPSVISMKAQINKKEDIVLKITYLDLEKITITFFDQSGNQINQHKDIPAYADEEYGGDGVPPEQQ